MGRRIVFLFFLFLLPPCAAEAGVDFGASVGVNCINNDISEFDGEKAVHADNYTGFFIGPVMEAVFLPSLRMDVSALYSQRGMLLSNGVSLKNRSVSFPVSLKLVACLGDVFGLFVQSGPQVDISLGERHRTVVNPESGETSVFDLKKAVLSLNLGGGMELGCVHLSVNYNLPLSTDGVYSLHDISSQITSDAFKSSTLQFVLSLVF